MPKFHLFDVFGIELEYMIVDRDTLKVRPIADDLIREMTGEYVSDVERGPFAWSNELVTHVIELKTNGPSSTLSGLSSGFANEVSFINEHLAAHNAMLLPTGAHPLFKPENETVIWPHEHNEVYELYDRIFGCKGHGWSNLQSTHINLPFANDEEFAALHSAIRLILPIIPALCASTPIIEGKATGFIDTRIEYYRKNQQKIKAIGGLIIPEPVTSQDEYERDIFGPIIKAIKPHDTEGVLDKYFLNSRGAISRFDRGAIEIRLVDIQESPMADIAVVELIVAAVRWLTDVYRAHPKEILHACSTQELADILIDATRFGSMCACDNKAYLERFGLSTPATLIDVWKRLFELCKADLSEEAHVVCLHIFKHGNLSERLLHRMADDPTEEGIVALYKDLAEVLATNSLFHP